jgi:ABC-type transporter Mla maintaining outer membrane lipid asymmetry ATPase subunit MlaF/ABC-type transporter Mla maintaining outer membrane lipid asymmetry permease subunit MlaE
MCEAATRQNTELLAITDLTVEVAGKTLLDKAALTLNRGDFVLLVGPSGAGKSVLLKIITGLIEGHNEVYKIDGQINLNQTAVVGVGYSARKAKKAFRTTGLVFQDHALFDQFNVRHNLHFARDHSNSPNAGQATDHALQFLKESGIHPDSVTQTLSGGQKQRVAIARTLSADPDLLVYDEPTSSLDPRSSRDVAEMISKSSTDFQKTALVVSHDYAPFVGLAKRVVFLDPKSKTLKEIPFDELSAVMAEAKVAEIPADVVESVSAADMFKIWAKARCQGFLAFLEGTWLLLWGLVRSLPFVLPIGGRPRWLLRYSWHYARLIFWGSAIPYMMIAGIIVGFVVTYFTFSRLPHGQHFQDEILPVLGAALYRVVIPVLTTLLIAGRTSAALASDLGNKVLNHQIAAMKNFGVSERAYLQSTILWMNAFGTLFLNMVAFAASSLTSLVVFTLTQAERTPFFWASHFFTKLRPEDGGWLPPDSGFVFFKLLVCSLVTATVSYKIGTTRKRSGAEVSFGTTTTVYWATVSVLVVHFIFAFFEFDKPPI